MNTARWDAWVAMVHASDSTLVQLATMAAAAVLIWEQMRRVPDPWRGRMQTAYLFGLLILFYYLIGGQMDTLTMTAGLFVIGFCFSAASLLAVWLSKRKPAQNSTVENQTEVKS